MHNNQQQPQYYHGEVDLAFSSNGSSSSNQSPLYHNQAHRSHLYTKEQANEPNKSLHQLSPQLLSMQPELLIQSMQNQYETRLRMLQLEVESLKSEIASINGRKRDSNASANHNNHTNHIVETYCENIQTKEFICKNCQYKTKSEVSLIIHNANHLVTQRYLHLPTTVFSIRPSGGPFITHMYPCGECSGKFSYTDLYLHIYQHHTHENPFHCDECDLFFMHFEFLDDHQRTEHHRPTTHMKKKHRSYHYHQELSNNNNLASIHSTNQSELVYYSVVKCSKPFSVLGATNTTTKNGSNWNGQSSDYYHQPTRRRGRGGNNTNSHSTRPQVHDKLIATSSATEEASKSSILKCHFEDCYFTTDSRDRLEFHLIAHNSRFRCPFCPFVSNVLNDIKRHVLKNQKHGGSMYNCPNCNYVTNCDKSFRDHLRTTHLGKQITDQQLVDFIEKLFENRQTLVTNDSSNTTTIVPSSSENQADSPS